MRAALLSALVIPGAGQLYNCQWVKGIALIVLFLVCSLAVLIPITLAVVGYYISLGAGNIDNAALALQPLIEEWIHLAVLVVASIGIYLYSIIDAYRQRLDILSRISTQVDKSDE